MKKIKPAADMTLTETRDAESTCWKKADEIQSELSLCRLDQIKVRGTAFALHRAIETMINGLNSLREAPSAIGYSHSSVTCTKEWARDHAEAKHTLRKLEDYETVLAERHRKAVFRACYYRRRRARLEWSESQGAAA